MSSIVIFPGSVASDGGLLRISGVAVVEPDSPGIPWSMTASFDAGALVINQAIEDAAVAAAEAENYVVGMLDKKTLMCGAVSL